MAKNVTFAHALLMGTMLKISIKFNILNCFVPCERFLNPHGPGDPIPLPQTVKDSVGEKSWSDSKLTESSEYECDDDQQPMPLNQAGLNDLVRDLNLPKASALTLDSRLKAKRMLSTVAHLLGINILRMNIFVSLPNNTL